jgi:hypothetical protein
MSNEQRTAIYGVVAALLAAAGSFGLITAEEAEQYGVSAVAILGALTQVLSAVKTWKQRGSSANVTVRVEAANAENAEAFAAALRNLDFRNAV